MSLVYRKYHNLPNVSEINFSPNNVLLINEANDKKVVKNEVKITNKHAHPLRPMNGPQKTMFKLNNNIQYKRLIFQKKNLKFVCKLTLRYRGEGRVRNYSTQ